MNSNNTSNDLTRYKLILGYYDQHPRRIPFNRDVVSKLYALASKAAFDLEITSGRK